MFWLLFVKLPFIGFCVACMSNKFELIFFHECSFTQKPEIRMNIRFNVRKKIDIQIKATIKISTCVMELGHWHFMCGHMELQSGLDVSSSCMKFCSVTELTVSWLLVGHFRSFLDQKFPMMFVHSMEQVLGSKNASEFHKQPQREGGMWI